MTLVPAGVLQMGSTSGDDDEKPVHSVKIDSFYLANTETTYAEFKAFVEATGYKTVAEREDGSYVWDSLGWHKREGLNWRHDERGRLREQYRETYENYPVTHVSFEDAARYCNWLSERENLVKVYLFGDDGDILLHFKGAINGYRLPFESEWEYAAAECGKMPPNRFAGDNQLGAVAWYSGNASHHAMPVAMKKPVLHNIYDLSGNVWEWCHDVYDKNHYKNAEKSASPSSPPEGRERTIRGGSWNNNSAHCRITNRSSRVYDFRDGSLGFRVMKPVH